MTIERTYTRDDLVVNWAPTLCERCHNCVNALPGVFDANRRPWVDLSRAPIEDIRFAVLDCPTGALSLGEKPK